MPNHPVRSRRTSKDRVEPSEPATSSVTHKAGFNFETAVTFQLAVLTNLISQPFYEQVGRTSGMSLNDWRILLVLAAKPGLSQAEIVHATGLHKMTVSRSLKSLKAFVRQDYHPTDKRKRIAFLTGKGVKQYDAALPALLDRQTLLEKALPPAELQLFKQMLSRLISRAREW